jgi:hypothetical protein
MIPFYRFGRSPQHNLNAHSRLGGWALILFLIEMAAACLWVF